MADPEDTPSRRLARVTAPTERGRLVARGSVDNPANRFERLAYAEDPEFVDEEPVDGGDARPVALRTRYYRDPSRTLLARNESPDIGFDVSINPYRGCEHGCTYCLAPDTPVLGADLVWRPIGELRVGDQLVGFDEHPLSPRHKRKLRRARVEAIWWSRKPTLRLVTRKADVVTTAEHRWLQCRPEWWSRTDRLLRGELIHQIASEDVDRLRARGLGDASFGVMPALDPEPIEAIEPGPVRDVVDIQTSTGTFYAAGLASHNCYARPTHEYLGLSAGLDFETHILVKEDAPALLEKALGGPSWQPEVVAIGGVTDPYQPVERRLRITRGCLAVFAKYRNPCAVITKSGLVTRDIDLLRELAEHGAAAVNVSITSLDDEIRRVMEPRASPPHERLRAVEALANAGIPVGVMVAPIVPGLTDSEIPALVAAAARAGARTVRPIVLRLPYGVADLFEAWLARHFPERAAKVMSRVRALREGRRNDARFHTRLRGTGVFAEQIHSLFDLACRRAGVNVDPPQLSTAAFRRPGGQQLALL